MTARKVVVGPTCALGLSLGVNVLQGRRILSLLDSRPSPTASTIVPPTLHVQDLDGKDVEIDLRSGSRPTVIYVFRPSCVWCQRKAHALQTLTATLSKNYRFVGLSLSDDSVAQFVSEHEMRFPVFKNLATNELTNMGLRGTPETIVISSAGRTLARWNGAYLGATKVAIESFFSVKIDESGM